MRRLSISALALPATIFLGVAGLAQAQEQAAQTYTYGSYHVCDLAKQERADEIYAQLDKPILDAAVADKTINAYGMYAHHTGGSWRRLTYFTGPSVQALLDAQQAMSDKADATNKKLGQEYATICRSHDDYIWNRVLGPIGTANPSGAPPAPGRRDRASRPRWTRATPARSRPARASTPR